ncbi:MAG: phosphoribosylamine--glycine ligase [Clostridiales bacterium]|jgi:phosphoribosylamine--glycine ligase|nr:phosphoribosylamine--glycine ligase [Clostridiales bacterium]
MNVLIIGGGGREHAIAWALKKSPKVDLLYAVPGNAGIAEIAEKCFFDVKVMDFDRILDIVKKYKIDLTVVAPDDPLGAGLVDLLNQKGYKAFGPVKEAARLEASKSFAKDFMKKYDIPTAKYAVFDDYIGAVKYALSSKHPLVIKADGLAVGKGVIISQNTRESKEALDLLMRDKKFGASGDRVVIEEFLQGPEITVLAFCDGKSITPMASSQDHKRAFDNDEGLNTGGMGTFSPSRVFTRATAKEFADNIMIKTVKGLISEDIIFKGVIYFGLMLTDEGLKVIEYNARFGDPEAQVVLPRLETDLLDIFNACIDGNLSKLKIEFNNDACVCVILASGGYPGEFEKGLPIDIGDIDSDVMLFHSGTAPSKDGKRILTNGGRVLGVTARGKNIEEARKKAYDNVAKISFKDMRYRTDIGIKK